MKISRRAPPPPPPVNVNANPATANPVTAVNRGTGFSPVSTFDAVDPTKGANPDPSIGGGGRTERPGRDEPPNDPEAARAAIEASATMQAMAEVEREQVRAIAAAASPAGLTSLQDLMEREGGITRLRNADKDGNSLLTNLTHLAQQPVNDTLAGDGVTSQKLLDDVLTDVARPNAIEQGSAQTCTVAAMQYQMARNSPSEYVRLMTGLAGPTGGVDLRGNIDGGAPERLTAIGNGSDLRNRVSSEVVFQNAAMEYANGELPYDPSADASNGRAGLFGPEQRKLLGALTGKEYSFISEPQAIPRGSTPETALRAFLEQYQASKATEPVLLNLTINGVNHAVAFEKIEGGRAFYRDPLGERSDVGPPAEFDKASRLYSIPADLFDKQASAIYQPIPEGARRRPHH